MQRTGLRRLTAMPKQSTPMQRNKPLKSGAQSGQKLRGAEGAPIAARKVSRRETGPSAKTRALVLLRDGYRCVCCGESITGRPYSLQHRKRRSQGGDNSPSNLLTVLGDGTRGCHARIDSRIDPDDEAKGYTVRSWDDPARIPVMLFSRGGGITAWLTADGTYSFEPPEGP